jgi:hypothetical protein
MRPDNLNTLSSFYNAFKPGGAYDFKLISPIYDASANLLYGGSGQAAGFSPSVLQGIGHAIHGVKRPVHDTRQDRARWAEL